MAIVRGWVLLSSLGRDNNAHGGMVITLSLSLLRPDNDAGGRMVAASSMQAVVVVVVGAVAGSHRCRCLVDNAGGRWMTVGMGMGVIMSSPLTLGMVTGVVVVVGRRWGWGRGGCWW